MIQAEYHLLPLGIHHDPARRCWALVTNQSMYALGVTPEGFVVHLYWGQRLASLADLPTPQLNAWRGSQEPNLHLTPEEYAPWGGLRYSDTAAKVTFADGVRDLDLRFDRAMPLDDLTTSQGFPGIDIILRDPVYHLEVALRYQIDVANDVIIRSAIFTNHGTAPLTLERALSAQWHVAPSDNARTLVTMAGHSEGEFRLQERAAVAGTALVESRRGITGPLSPWLALAEADGAAYAVTLAWSGNWLLRATTDLMGATTVVGGIHDDDFAWHLAPGQSFATPASAAVFAADGLAGAQHRLHRYVREAVLPASHRTLPRPVLYNSWEATYFDVTSEGQQALAERAARMGVELFVVDDGWFAGRNDDHAALGDWYPDPQKFPNGLRPLIDSVQALGMAFGLWVEPEMVNANSELYRAHPDWIYHFATRPRNEARHQLVLNLGREDVRSYLLEVLDRLVTEQPIAFLKWDMNRPISEPGWPDYVAAGGDAREIWVRHVEGVYQIMDALRARHPHLSIESCASGGSRADYAILTRTDQVWTSDNTHPDARLFIQEGFAQVFPARVMTCWVTDNPKNRRRNEVPLAYRAHVAMLGTLGIGGDLTEWGDDELAEMGHWVETYKRIRPVIQDGDVRWLWSPRTGDRAAVQYITADQSRAVVFGFRRSNHFHEVMPTLRLTGLDLAAPYQLTIDGQDLGVKTGAWLMRAGLELPLAPTSYASCIIELQRQA